jgi:membrane fusion protein, multidrug efflux system
VIAADAKPLFRHKRILVAAISFVVIVAAGWLIRDSAIYERTDVARVEARILPLSARINGHVQQLNVVEGQLVHAGDVLAVIDQRAYDIAVFEARANLASAQYAAAALYLNAAITVTTAYAGLNAAQAAVRNALVEVKNAEHKLRADEAVLERTQVDGPFGEAIAAADQLLLLQAQDKLAEAATDLRAAQTAPQQASLAKVEAEAADAQVLQRKAELERAELNLSYTILRSPIAGLVGGKRLELGQSVRIGQELIDIVSLGDVWITANFKETQLDRLWQGQPVEIKVDAYGRTWRGHITSLGATAGSVFTVMPPRTSIPNPVKAAQRVPVRIDFDRPESHDFNAEGMLKPGLSAESKVRVRGLSRVQAQSRLPALSGPNHGAKGVVGPLADFR